MMTDVLYAVTILGASGLIWDGWRRYLAKDTATVRELRIELKGTQEDWEKRFHAHERELDTVGKHVKALAARDGVSPLGKSYSTRSAG